MSSTGKSLRAVRACCLILILVNLKAFGSRREVFHFAFGANETEKERERERERKKEGKNNVEFLQKESLRERERYMSNEQ